MQHPVQIALQWIRRCAVVCLVSLAAAEFGASVALADVEVSQSPAKEKPIVRPYPDARVWQDAEVAAKEFAHFAAMGEYVREGQALQVVPAEGRFYFSLYQGGLPGAGWDGEVVAHRWVDPSAVEEQLEAWNKVDRSREVVGMQPPAGATVLFDGTSTDKWANGRMHDGCLMAGTRTKKIYKDFHLYLEFMVPLKPAPPLSHPHRGNSGVFAAGAYEVQLIDSFGLDMRPAAWSEQPMLKPADLWCGSIYGIRAPTINMCLPPLEWQSLEMEFRAARFEGEKKVSPAVMTVRHNGVVVHDAVELPRGTGGGPAGPRPEVPEGPIVLQDHGNPNLFRNIWVVEP